MYRCLLITHFLYIFGHHNPRNSYLPFLNPIQVPYPLGVSVVLGFGCGDRPVTPNDNVTLVLVRRFCRVMALTFDFSGSSDPHEFYSLAVFKGKSFGNGKSMQGNPLLEHDKLSAMSALDRAEPRCCVTAPPIQSRCLPGTNTSEELLCMRDIVFLAWIAAVWVLKSPSDFAWREGSTPSECRVGLDSGLRRTRPKQYA
jgi:hypothetical protein